jgi:hypothetical protein
MEPDRSPKTPATGSHHLDAGRGPALPELPFVPVIDLDAVVPAPGAPRPSAPPARAAEAVSWLIADALGDAPPAASLATPALGVAKAPAGVVPAAAAAPAPVAAGAPVVTPAPAEDPRAAQLAEDLFGDIAQPVAPTLGASGAETKDLLAELPAQTERLERARQHLLEQKRAAEAEPKRQDLRQRHERARGDAQAALEAACNVIEQLPDDERLIEVRRDLVDAYFKLERVLAPEGPLSEADAAAAAARAQRMQRLGKTKAVGSRVRAPSKAWSRPVKLGVFLGVAVVARLAYFFAVENQPQAVITEELAPALPGGLIARPAGPTSRSLRSRAVPPEVRLVVLSQTAEGLQVQVAAASDRPATLTYSYTWWENGKIVAEGRESKLPAKNLTPGARYRVEIEVADDKGRTMAKTEELQYDAAGAAAAGAKATAR